MIIYTCTHTHTCTYDKRKTNTQGNRYDEWKSKAELQDFKYCNYHSGHEVTMFNLTFMV